MTNDKAEMGSNTDIATASHEQLIERDASGLPATAPVRPWTSEFLLPSIRYREPSAPKSKHRAH
jgi:hypothetical protein